LESCNFQVQFGEDDQVEAGKYSFTVLLGIVTLMFVMRKGIVLISYSMYCAGVDCSPEKNQLTPEDKRNLLFRRMCWK